MAIGTIGSRFQRGFKSIIFAAAGLGAGLGLVAANQYGSRSETARLLSAPQVNVLDMSRQQAAVFAGGCFWGTQGIFQHVKGVISATAGYAGGTRETATYEETETGQTDHAEAVRVVFDPAEISYGDLLRIFFSVAHDPTQRDRQGPDVGHQYRSAVFPQTNEQADVTEKYIHQLLAEKAFPSSIATTVELGKSFYAAESYHQDYLNNNPGQPYIYTYELPRIDNLKHLFPELYREKPVLVSETGRA